jgi:hypothetical protein
MNGVRSDEAMHEPGRVERGHRILRPAAFLAHVPRQLRDRPGERVLEQA